MSSDEIRRHHHHRRRPDRARRGLLRRAPRRQRADRREPRAAGRPGLGGVPREAHLRRRRLPQDQRPGADRPADRPGDAVRARRAAGRGDRDDLAPGRRRDRAAHRGGRDAAHADDDHHGRPRRLQSAQARPARPRAVGGQRAALLRQAQGGLRRPPGGAGRRRRLGARLGARPAGHGRAADHADPPPRPLPRAGVVGQRGAPAGRRGPGRDPAALRGARGRRATAGSSRSRSRTPTTGEMVEHAVRRAGHPARVRVPPRPDRQLGAGVREQAPDPGQPGAARRTCRASTRRATWPATRARSR